MLKLLTRFRLRSDRDLHNLQITNPNLNLDSSQEQQQQDKENNAGEDDDVGRYRAQTASSSERRTGNSDDDVSWERETQTASSSEIWTSYGDEDGVSGYQEFQTPSSTERVDDENDSGNVGLDMASSSDGRTNDDGDDDVGRGTEVKELDKGVEPETASSSEMEREAGQKSSAATWGEQKRMEAPPSDDCCPICFGNFNVPCQGPCGHWYCGGCILQYWNYTAALQPCNCPMCSRKITKLTPEGSLYQLQEAEVVEVLRNVRKYNRLFVGGTYGLILKAFELPVYIKRMFSEMMNPDRPGAHLNKLRIFAMFLGVLYSISPFDFLRIGRRNVVDIFDYSAIMLSLILYGYGIYQRRRRFRHVRELAEIQL